MADISEYWSKHAPRLRAEFERIRAAHRDPDVKGGANEQILSEFLRQNLAASNLCTGSSIIDPHGNQSDEVDVAVCNDYQPFHTRGSGELLIAEGVDAVYQVKARLDSAELKRAVKNCRSVKRLRRGASDGDMVLSNPADTPRFVDRIPYFIFAFETAVTMDTAYRTLTEACDGLEYHEQPDGVFTLNDWYLFNVGTNDGALRLIPAEARGFQTSSSGPGSLASMMWHHYAYVTPVRRAQHPLLSYAPWLRLS